MKERLWQKAERLTRELYKTRQELRRTKNELSEVMRDVKAFLSPPGGTCTREAFFTRCVCHGQVGLECPFIMCVQWFDNPQYMNCERYVEVLARRSGSLTEEELAQVNNLFRDGKLGAAYIKKAEERAVEKLRRGLKTADPSRDGPYVRYMEALFGMDSKGWQRMKRRLDIAGSVGELEKLIEEEKNRQEEKNGRRRFAG